MPRYVIPGRNEAITFPDDMSEKEIAEIMAREYPPTAEEVYKHVIENPHYVPTEDQYRLFEEHNKIEDAKPMTADAWGNVAKELGSTIGGGLKSIAQFKQFNAATQVEGTLQGTRNFWGMVRHSTNPESSIFRFWAKHEPGATMGRDGSPDFKSRYQHFLKEREFAADSLALENREDYLAFPPEETDPALTKFYSYTQDLPSMILPELLPMKMAGKATRFVAGQALSKGGRLAEGIIKPVVKAGEKLQEIVQDVAKVTPEQIEAAKKIATIAGLGGTAAGLPYAPLIAGASHGLDLAESLAQAAKAAGGNLLEAPGRIGPLEAIGKISGADPLQRAIGTIGRFGGDAAVDALAHGALTAAGGAGIGAGLGYLSDRERGAVHGAAFGTILGGAFGAGTRGIQRATGALLPSTRVADLKRFMAQQTTWDQAKLQHMIDRDGVDAIAKFMDGVQKVGGSLKDAHVRWVNDAEFEKEFKGSGRGVEFLPDDGSGPTIVINTDHPRSDATLGHEMFHLLDRMEEFTPGVQELKRKILGSFDTAGNRLTKGHLSDAEIEESFRRYYKKAEGNPNLQADLDALDANGRRERVFKETAAEYLSNLVAGSSPDALLRGFGGTTRAVLDRLLTKHADTLVGRMAARLTGKENNFDSLVFGKNLPEASKEINALLRDLVRAREALNEKMSLRETDRSYKRGEALPEKLAAEMRDAPIRLTQRNVDGTFTIRSDAELQGEEKKFNEALKQAISSVPVADPSKPHMREVDGNLVGEGFSPEQVAAIMNHPTLGQDVTAQPTPGQAGTQFSPAQASAGVGRPPTRNKVKEVMGHLMDSMNRGDELYVTYGAATQKKNGKTTYGTIALSDRRLIPYRLQQNKVGGWYFTALDMTKAEQRAQKLGKAGKLGPYGTADTFMSDLKKYLINIGRGAGERTVDYFKARGDTTEAAEAKAAFLRNFFLQAEKGTKLVGNFRLDRVVSVEKTGNKFPFDGDLAWKRAGEYFMPAEKIGETTVSTSRDGDRIIKSPSGKWRLYKPDGSLAGIYETQAAAEAKADPFKGMPRGDGETPRYFMPDPVISSRHAPSEEVRNVASEYMRSIGREYKTDPNYSRVPVELGKLIADHYDRATTNPHDPEVQAAYKAFSDETMAQYAAMTKAGVKIEPWMDKGQPYKNSGEMIADVKNNKHLWFFPTEHGFGEPTGNNDIKNNPLLADSGVRHGDKPLVVNDIFRAVHDYFGHVKEGNQFGPRGEFNAWRNHHDMYTEAAQPALATESLAQNSWVNFGPQMRDAAGNIRTEVPLTERAYADQKVIATPRDFMDAARNFMPAEKYEGFRIGTAPTRTEAFKKVTDPQNFKTKAYQKLVALNRKVADSLEISRKFTNTMGGWRDTQTGKQSKESGLRSNLSEVADEGTAKGFAGAMGSLAPDVQNAVMIVNYNKPQKTAMEMSFQAKDNPSAEALSKKLTKYGFNNYTYDATKREFLLALPDAKANDFQKLVTGERARISPGSSKSIPADVTFPGPGDYRNLLAAGLQANPKNRAFRDIAQQAVQRLNEVDRAEKQKPRDRHMNFMAAEGAAPSIHTKETLWDGRVSDTVTRDEKGNLYFKGKEPKDWDAEDFKGFGDEVGVPGLGGLSEVQRVPSGNGGMASIPGGLEGKFTLFDTMWLKANGPEVKHGPEADRLSEQVHARLTEKLARTMTPPKGDTLEALNRMLFGILSANAPLMPNEFAHALLKFRNVDDVKKFASLLPDGFTPQDRERVNQYLKKSLGISAKDAAGIGIGISGDLGDAVNMARLWLKNPNFFVKRADESWHTFVDKMSTQFRGLGTKTAIFGGVWQDPLHAMVSAIDRHMARLFAEQIINVPERRKQFDTSIADKFNEVLEESKQMERNRAAAMKRAGDDVDKVAAVRDKYEPLQAALPDPKLFKAKNLDDVMGQAEAFGPERLREFINDVVLKSMGAAEGKYKIKGEISPRLPETLRGVEFIETPEKFQTMTESYRDALRANEEKANELGVAVYPAQWTVWDRIRERIEPHEVNFPGYHKLPKMSREQLQGAWDRATAAGWQVSPGPIKRGLHTPGELTYFMPDPSFPGASSFGGYRIMPSKTGNFRVYAPGGALVGVQASQEQARRLVQRKAGAAAR